MIITAVQRFEAPVVQGSNREVLNLNSTQCISSSFLSSRADISSSHMPWVVVMYCQVSSNLWQPCKRSYPLTVLLRSCRFKTVDSLAESIHLIFSHALSCYLQLLPRLFFSSDSCLLTMCSKYDSLSLVFLVPKESSGLFCSNKPIFLTPCCWCCGFDLYTTLYC